jgi:hypothetical protein
MSELKGKWQELRAKANDCVFLEAHSVSDNAHYVRLAFGPLSRPLALTRVNEFSRRGSSAFLVARADVVVLATRLVFFELG